MIAGKRFYYTLMKKMAELFSEGKALDPEKLDKKAYKLAKALVAEYENDNPEDIVAPFEADGMVFKFMDRDRHFTKFRVTFVGMRNGFTDGGVPMAEFEFEILEGPYKGKRICHTSVHTKGFKHQYKTEENFVKDSLKYKGAYDAKNAEENDDYAKVLNERLVGEYEYLVEYFPMEGGHRDTKVKITEAIPTDMPF